MTKLSIRGKRTLSLMNPFNTLSLKCKESVNFPPLILNVLIAHFSFSSREAWFQCPIPTRRLFLYTCSLFISPPSNRDQQSQSVLLRG